MEKNQARFITSLIIALYTFLMFLNILSPETALAAATCTDTYTSGAVPNGYGAAYNLFSSVHEPFVSVGSCTDTSASVNVGNGNSALYVYKDGYYWTGSVWQKVSFTSGSALQSGNWYLGEGHASIPMATGNSERFYVGYTCQQVSNVWKCGCHDTMCTTPAWQLQKVTKTTSAGGGSGTTLSLSPYPYGTASGLRDSIGYATHAWYHDGPYDQWSKVLDKLGYMGVRHIRDNYKARSDASGNLLPSTDPWHAKTWPMMQMAYQRGFKLCASMGFPAAGDPDVADLLKVLQAGYINPDLISCWEWPNEVDLFRPNLWFQPLLDYEKVAVPLIRNSAFNRLVVGPSIVGSWNRAIPGDPDIPANAQGKQIGDQTALLDYANLHNYRGGRSPLIPKLIQDMHDDHGGYSHVSGNKPIVVTEMGYRSSNNPLGDQGDTGQPIIPGDVAANYVIRTFLTNYKYGIQRTYRYELVDAQDPAAASSKASGTLFGAFNYDWTPRPEVEAVHNLTTLLGPLTATKKPTALAVTTQGHTYNRPNLSGGQDHVWKFPNDQWAYGDAGNGLDEIYTLPVQKADGSWLVFVWRSVEPFGFDRNSGVTTNRHYVTPSTETITVGIPKAKTAELANVLHSTNYSPLTVTGAGAPSATVSIQLADEPLCIHVTM